MQEKPHLSPTQLDMLFRCGEQYRRVYVEGERIPPGVAMAKGAAMHAGAKENFEQKIKTWRDLTVEQIVEAADAAFKTSAERGLWFSPEETSRGKTVVLEEAAEAAREMAAFHGEHQAPEYQPDLVEHKGIISFDEFPYDLVGILDLADNRGRVVDFKTASRKRSQDDADNSTQLTTYRAIYRRARGQPPSELRLDVVVKTAKKTERQVLSTARDDRDLDALAHRINAAVNALQHPESLLPTGLGSWACSPKWCGFWPTCPYVNSDRKAAAGA